MVIAMVIAILIAIVIAIIIAIVIVKIKNNRMFEPCNSNRFG